MQLAVAKDRLGGQGFESSSIAAAGDKSPLDSLTWNGQFSMSTTARLTTRGSWAHERKLGVALACAPFFVTNVKRPLARGIHDCRYGTYLQQKGHEQDWQPFNDSLGLVKKR
jgi:hypothetical protein